MGDLEALRRRLRELRRVTVAFSGGADSAFLAWIANDTLGRSASHAVTAVSASLPDAEARECAALAAEWDLHWTAVETDELTRDDYVTNGPDRCFHCKSALMDVLEPLAAADGSVVVLGTNVDDLGDHRPGQRAAADRGAAFPLVDAGFTKVDVRAASRALGLRTWDKPAAACLASRLPYGTPVSLGRLSQVERAEAALHRLGFRQVRVRHFGDVARVEVGSGQLDEALAANDRVAAAVRSAGYAEVQIDPQGYRQGSLNAVLAAER
jgi:uncharacterized protein